MSAAAVSSAPSPAPAGGRAGWLDGAIMLAVSLLSLLLLVYVGYAEAGRTYPRFVVDKMAAQGDLVKTPMEAYLRAGLPLRQFPGFRPMAERLLQSDAAIAGLAVVDAGGAPVFSAARPAAVGEAPRAPPILAGPAPAAESHHVVRRDGTWLQVVLPLRDRYGAVGAVVVSVPRASLAATLRPYFPPIAAGALALSLVFALVALRWGRRLRATGRPWLEAVFAANFLVVAAAVVWSLVQIYADGAQSKARALAESLRERLEPIVEFGLRLEDFEGLGALFAEYRRLDPDIRAIGLSEGGTLRIHTEAGQVGRPWTRDPGAYEFVAVVGRGEGGAELRVAVTLPSEVVWRAVGRSGKNFAALFVAVALMAGLFLGLARALGDGTAPAGEAGREAAVLRRARAVGALKPLFFLAVFVESLPTGFLPQLLRDATAASGLGGTASSLAFAVYFVCFLAALLPATGYAERHGARRLLIGGAVLAAAGAGLLVFAADFAALVASRALAGIGQGLLLIGAQSFVLANAPAGQRTQAASIIVFGFNGGMIAGTVIGSLLVNYIEPTGVFALAGATSLVVAAVAALLLPGAPGGAAPAGVSPHSAPVPPRMGFGALARGALGSLEFLRAMLLVGAPAKAVLTGIVAFALPLVLAGMKFPPEDIGQVVMLYPAGVLLATGWMARRVDAKGETRGVLALGTALSGVGLVMVGALGWSARPGFLAGGGVELALLLAGVLVLGLAHGCINAPVITHVADTDVARRLGPSPVAAFYRVVERVGHVLGPAIAGQLLAAAGGGALAILWVGVIMLAFALLFWLMAGRRRSRGEATP